MPYHVTDDKKPKKKVTTLKEAISKFNELKNKPKSNMNSDGKLSKRLNYILIL